MAAIFNTNYLLIFLVIIIGNYVTPMIIADQKDVDLCTKMTGLIWHFTWPYFKNKHAVAVFAHQDNSLEFSDEIKKCAMKNPELSVLYNTSIWNINGVQENKTRLIKNESLYRHGMMFIKDTSENIKTIFPAIDQETKVILILTNASVEDVHNILKLAWSQYHLLDLVIFHTINGTQNDLNVSIYDPFIIKNNIRGYIHTFLITNHDSLTNEILKIMSTRLIDVHGYPLIVATSSELYLITDECDNPNCEIVHALMATLNFQPEYYLKAVDHIKREVEQGRADMMARTSFLNNQGLNLTEYLFPIDYQGNNFIAPKMQPSSTVSFVKIFNPVVSVALALSYIVMVVAWRCLNKKYQEIMKDKTERMDFVNICCVTLGNFLLISQPNAPVHRYERCLLISWLFFSMLICWHYQGTMVEHLTAGGPSRDYNTLEKLAESDLNIFLYGSDQDLLKTYAGEEDAPSFYAKILKNSHIISPNDLFKAAEFAAEYKDIAAICNTVACMLCKTMYSSIDTGEDLLHIVEEELSGGYVSFPMPLDSPYKDRFNDVLMKIVESGLMQKWKKNYDDWMETYYLTQRVYNPQPMNDVYKMKDLSGIFWSWLGCCCFCFVIFLGELLWFYICKYTDDLMFKLLSSGFTQFGPMYLAVCPEVIEIQEV